MLRRPVSQKTATVTFISFLCLFKQNYKKVVKQDANKCEISIMT